MPETTILIANNGYLELHARTGNDGCDARPAEAQRFLTCSVPRTTAQDRDFLQCVETDKPAGIYLGDVQSPADIEKATTLLRVAEARLGRSSLPIAIIAALDTAQAALAIESFNRPIPRLRALAFDARRLAAAIGAADTSQTILAVRAKVPLAARASGVDACFWLEVSGPSGNQLHEVWRQARDDGFSAFVAVSEQDAMRIAEFAVT